MVERIQKDEDMLVTPPKLVYVYPDEELVTTIKDFVTHKNWESGQKLLTWADNCVQFGLTMQQVIDERNALVAQLDAVEEERDQLAALVADMQKQADELSFPEESGDEFGQPKPQAAKTKKK